MVVHRDWPTGTQASFSGRSTTTTLQVFFDNKAAKAPLVCKVNDLQSLTVTGTGKQLELELELQLKGMHTSQRLCLPNYESVL